MDYEELLTKYQKLLTENKILKAENEALKESQSIWEHTVILSCPGEFDSIRCHFIVIIIALKMHIQFLDDLPLRGI